jgi:ribosomal protein S18 acetylase RimI-like enzyme
MNTLRITPATANDIPTLLDFMEQFYVIDGYPFYKEKTQQSLIDFFSSAEQGVIWLIYDDNTAIGYFILALVYNFEHGGRNAFLDEFYLTDACRGKGIGKIVMSFLDEQAKKMNIKALHLEVEQHNTGALELYKKFHFKEGGRLLMTRTIDS